MRNAWLIACVAVVAMLAGCSGSEEPAARPSGALPPGTAEVAIDDARVDTTHAVNCSSGDGGPITTITTGDDKSGTTSAIGMAENPTVKFAEFRSIGGFTGSYWDQLGPKAEIAVTGSTFQLKGTAFGFSEENPSARITKTFSIKVAC